MKRYGIAAVCGLVLLGALASVDIALGQDNRGDQERPRGRQEQREGQEQQEQKRPSPKEQADNVFQRLVKELNLDEDKQAEIKTIWKAHRQAVVNWTKEHGEELKAAQQKLREAQKEEDREAAVEARKEIQKINKTRIPLVEDFVKQLRGALSEEQLEKARKILRLGAMQAVRARFDFLRLLGELNLSDKQKDQIEKIMQEAREKIVKDVLTPAQRKKVEELRNRVDRPEPKREEPKREEPKREGPKREETKREETKREERFPFMRALGELNVTDEQEVQIRKIMNEARAEAKEADTPAAKARIMRKAEAKIVEDVLNKEQRRKLQSIRSEWLKKNAPQQPPTPGRGPGGPGRGSRASEDEGER